MKIFLEAVKFEHASIIYEWANDAVTRANSFNTEKIKYNTHLSFMTEKINSADTLWYLLIVDDVPVSQVRLECRNRIGTINYSVGPQFRGNGYGRIMLAKLEDVARQNGITQLIGEVKSNNIISRRIFVGLNYQPTEKEGSFLYSKMLT